MKFDDNAVDGDGGACVRVSVCVCVWCIEDLAV